MRRWCLIRSNCCECVSAAPDEVSVPLVVYLVLCCTCAAKQMKSHQHAAQVPSDWSCTSAQRADQLGSAGLEARFTPFR